MNTTSCAPGTPKMKMSAVCSDALQAHGFSIFFSPTRVLFLLLTLNPSGKVGAKLGVGLVPGANFEEARELT